MSGQVYDVFLSFHPEDEEWSRGLLELLTWLKLRVFTCNDIEVGQSVVDERSRALEGSTYLVQVVTPAAAVGMWEGLERNAFLVSRLDAGESGRILPVLLRDAPWPALMKDIRQCRLVGTDATRYHSALSGLCAKLLDQPHQPHQPHHDYSLPDGAPIPEPVRPGKLDGVWTNLVRLYQSIIRLPLYQPHFAAQMESSGATTQLETLAAREGSLAANAYLMDITRRADGVRLLLEDLERHEKDFVVLERSLYLELRRKVDELLHPPEAVRKSKRSGSGAPERLDLDTLLPHYLENLRGFHREIELHGFNTRVSFPLDLEQVYVPLWATVQSRTLRHRPGGHQDEEAMLRDAGMALNEHEADSLEQDVPFHRALRRAWENHYHGLVILGDPGAGKTTLLRHFVVACTDEMKYGPKYLGLPEDTVPVLIYLRSLQRPADGLISAMRSAVAAVCPGFEDKPTFVQELLDRRHVLILVDGLDEVVDETERSAVSRWLEKATKQFPRAFFIVTSRFAGYRGEVPLRSRFLEMRVRPLREEEGKTFIRRWYEAVEARSELDRPADIAAVEASRRSQDLTTTIWGRDDQRARGLRRLATNPLMLQVICLVHRDRKALPKRRVELFAECLQVLLELWRRAKEMPLELTAVEAEELLRPVAWWLQCAGEKEGDLEELRRLLLPVLEELKRPTETADQLLLKIKDESGVLVPAGPGRYQFLHDSFREYLAARHVQDGIQAAPERIERLAENFREGSWGEVVLLSVALSGAPLFEPLLAAVIRKGLLGRSEQLLTNCMRDAFRPRARPFLEGLAGELRNATERYHVLRALRFLEGSWAEERLEVPPRLTGITLVRQCAEDRDPAVRGMARELLAARGVKLEKPLEPGDPWVHEATGLEFVYVPPGRFLMGGNGQYDGKPIHKVTFAHGFWIGKYPVTNAQWERFMKQGGGREPHFWKDSQWNAPEQPVVGVTWDDAFAYCKWASEVLLEGEEQPPGGASGIVLPSEAKWEYAARGAESREYPWGNSPPTLKLCNFSPEGIGVGRIGRTTPVGQYPDGASWVGAQDMAGNVWEWCADHWHDSYGNAPEDGSPWSKDSTVPSGGESIEKDPKKWRVARGGGWGDGAGGLRSASRDWGHPWVRGLILGFRLVAVAPKFGNSSS